MNQPEHVYTPPRSYPPKAIPPAVAQYLSGEDLLSKTQALRLTTIDADGWPHAALLSAGDMLALPDGPVSLEPDLGAAGCAISQLGETSPALLFDNIRGYHDAKIALNVHGSWPNQALALVKELQR